MSKKQCCKCGKRFELNADNFYRNVSMAGGFCAWCISCTKAYNRSRKGGLGSVGDAELAERAKTYNAAHPFKFERRSLSKLIECREAYRK